MRTIAVGDIHGHAAALRGLIDAIAPGPADTLVFLGDYLDHGPDSQGVIATLLDLQARCTVIALLGNHEEMAIASRTSAAAWRQWLDPVFGGQATLNSYGGIESVNDLPLEHLQFLQGLQRYHEVDTHFFVHANYAPNWRLADHDSRTALWLSLDDLPQPHYSGKIAVAGHTPQMQEGILDLGYLLCIDTGCGYGGHLSALDIESGQVWRVDEAGRLGLA
jgi:serine/threonine protein phosphatase 1